MSDALKLYRPEIDAVKEKIIEQKVPTKYPKGLAILLVLACNYSGGDALAGIFFESACKGDPRFLDDLDKEFGLEPETGVHWTRMKRIWDAGKKDYQIFRAIDVGSIQMNLMESIKDVE
jgi:hypothetical protein